MDQGYLSRKLGEIHGLLDCGISAADHVNLQVLEEVGVAGCTVGNTSADELSLSLACDGSGMRTGGNDKVFALILALGTLENLDLSLDIHFADQVGYSFYVKLLALLGHAGNQGRSGFALHDLSRVILDLGSNGNLSAVLRLLDDQDRETCASCVDTCCEACRARTENYDIIDFFHGNTPAFLFCAYRRPEPD